MNIVIRHIIDRLFLVPVTLIFCTLTLGCSSSDSDIKAIWSYEQRQIAEPDFQFYPLELKTVGQITVKDSLSFIEKSLVQPVDSLIRQNGKSLQGLLHMQSLYVKYDMETMRENISSEIGQLETSQKWLNSMKIKMEDYRNMPSDKVLVRLVECRFQYDVPVSHQKITKDKLYYIHTATGNVIQAQEKPLGKPDPSH